MEQAKNRILCIPQRGIGDLVHALPLLHSLKDGFSQYEITIPVVDKRQEESCRSFGNLFSEVISFSYRKIRDDMETKRVSLYSANGIKDRHKKDEEERKKFEKKMYDTYLRGEEYELAVVPRAFEIETILCGRQVNLNSLPKTRDMHAVDRNLRFVELLGINITKSFELNLGLIDDIKDCNGRKLELPEKYVTIVLSSGRPDKKWTVGGNKEIVKYCSKTGYTPILLGSEREYQESKGIEDGKTINLIGKNRTLIDLENTVRMLSRSSATIGPDTGLIHLADAVGTKVIGLYGPTRPSKFAPYHNRERVVSTNNSTGRMDDINQRDVLINLERALE